MLMKPLPDVRDAFSMILKQERRFSIGIGTLGNQFSHAGDTLGGGNVFLFFFFYQSR